MTTRTANGRYTVKRTAALALPCSSSTDGSAVRHVVTVRWIPNASWGKTPTTYAILHTAIVWTQHSAAQTVCSVMQSGYHVP